jgi:hypothetical protein
MMPSLDDSHPDSVCLLCHFLCLFFAGSSTLFIGEVCDALLGVSTDPTDRKKDLKCLKWFLKNKTNELLYKGVVEGIFDTFIGNFLHLDSWATGL